MFPLNLGQVHDRHWTHLTQESLAKQENPGQKKLTARSRQLTAAVETAACRKANHKKEIESRRNMGPTI